MSHPLARRDRTAWAAPRGQEAAALAAVFDHACALDAAGRVTWRSAALAAAGVATGLDAAAALAAAGFASETGGAAVAEDGAILARAAEAGGGVFRVVARAAAAGGRALALVDVSALHARLAAAARARAAFEERLNVDLQTGLPNERALIGALLGALRGAAPGRTVGLLLVDVIAFREIVDLYGADVGGMVMQELSMALGDALPEGMFHARSKDHELAIVVPDALSTAGLVALAERVVAALGIDVPTDLGDCRVDCLVALAACGEAGCSPDQILNNARIALGFRDLPRRAGQVRVFEPEMRAALEARTRTYNDLFAALDRDEIEPFFQPQIRLSDRAVVGLEVLVRWRHPEQGLVPPGQFLEIAEETGLLPRIDDVVMRRAMDRLAELGALGLGRPRIGLNCTGETLRDTGFADRLSAELAARGLGPGHVAVEILENVLFGDAHDTARTTLQRLSASGFHLEIDDFGTGQASISHLITLNADAVKLDRSLVRGILEDRGARLVVEATIALSRRLGLSTIAEGAECEEQMRLLADLGCDRVQGFGIAKPMTFDDLVAWLRAWPAGTA